MPKLPRAPLPAARLAVEDDRRLIRCLLAGTAGGLALVAYASSLPTITKYGGFRASIPRDKVERPVVFCPECGTRRGVPATMRHHHPPAKRVAQGAKPKAPAKGEGPNGVARIAQITSRSDRAGLNAYSLMDESFVKDLDKLDRVAGLTKTDPTIIGSSRHGMVATGFNTGAIEGTGTGDLPLTHWDGGGRPAATGVQAPSRPGGAAAMASSVGMVKTSGARSTEAILAVVRQHMSGLRHLYNQYLRRYSNLAGKVTLSLAIAPSGQVIDCGLVSSSTGAGDFDAEVLGAVRSWRFDPVAGPGEDIVTIPFNFSE